MFADTISVLYDTFDYTNQLLNSPPHNKNLNKTYPPLVINFIHENDKTNLFMCEFMISQNYFHSFTEENNLFE